MKYYFLIEYRGLLQEREVEETTTQRAFKALLGTDGLAMDPQKAVYTMDGTVECIDQGITVVGARSPERARRELGNARLRPTQTPTPTEAEKPKQKEE